MNPNLTAIRVFQTSADYADFLARWFESQGNDTQARQFFTRRDRLVTEVDILWNQLFDTWAGEAKSLTTRAKAQNVLLDQAVKKIEKNASDAQAALQALGLLDQIITLAKDVIP